MNINLTLIMQAIAFGVFIWFCARFIWPPLMRAIDTRQSQIAEGLAAGEQGRQSLASAEKRVADLLAEAKSRSSEIIAQGEKLVERFARAGRFVQRPVRLAAHALKEHLGGRVQVHHAAEPLEQRPVLVAGHDAAAGGINGRRGRV